MTGKSAAVVQASEQEAVTQGQQGPVPRLVEHLEFLLDAQTKIRSNLRDAEKVACDPLQRAAHSISMDVEQACASFRAQLQEIDQDLELVQRQLDREERRAEREATERQQRANDRLTRIGLVATVAATVAAIASAVAAFLTLK